MNLITDQLCLCFEMPKELFKQIRIDILGGNNRSLLAQDKSTQVEVQETNQEVFLIHFPECTLDPSPLDIKNRSQNLKRRRLNEHVDVLQRLKFLSLNSAYVL